MSANAERGESLRLTSASARTRYTPGHVLQPVSCTLLKSVLDMVPYRMKTHPSPHDSPPLFLSLSYSLYDLAGSLMNPSMLVLNPRMNDHHYHHH